MKYKKWIKKWFITLSLILGLPIVNYVIDPYQIMESKILPYQYQISERYLKIKFLEKNHSKFDSYLFGSSRIGTTDPKTIEQYLPGTKFYNFTLSSADFYDHINHLEYFIKKEYPIKNIYLQIDITNMESFKDVRSSYGQKLHPAVLGDKLIPFYIKYLFNVYPSSIIGKVKNNLASKNQLEYNISKGFWSKPEKEKKIKNNCEQYTKSEKSFHQKHERNKKSIEMNKTMESLRKFKELCSKHGIKLYLFTTPHNNNMMNTYNLNDYYKFLNEIVEISNFYDFSGYNSITNNNCNYYEWSHYRPKISKMIAARIFNDNTIFIPNDFGAYITKSNINSHITTLKKKENK